IGDGCAISQASASMLSEELRGKTLSEVREMDRDDIIDMLGVELSPMRIKCAVLAEKVAQDGIAIHEGDKELEETTTE
ncbi:iron-sulfur cluster assembly scaffold protein, partial [Natronomonas sp.]